MFDFINEIKMIKSSTNLSRQDQAEMMAKVELPTWLSIVSKYSVPTLVFCMWGISAAVALKLLTFANGLDGFVQYLAYSIIPFVFVFVFVFVGGIISRIGRFGIVEGKFPRKHSHPIYALRRIYGSSWTQVYYSKPLYAICLAVPLLRTFLFRLYGYRGSMSFTVYPDSWIRDLPLLNIGKNVYLANRCVVGTNLCLNDGSILVGSCTLHDDAMVGHLAVFGQGTILGEKSEIGVGASTGIRVRTGKHVHIAPKAIVYHAVELGNFVKIGGCAVVGMRSKIADGIEIRAGSIIAPGTEILSQKYADDLLAEEIQSLIQQKELLFETLREKISISRPA